MLRVSHFEIEADNVERAVEFYRNVFGWTVRKWEGPIGYWLITTGPDDEHGINGGLYKRETPITGEGIRAYICIIDVPSIDEYVAKVEANGGTVKIPKQTIPGVGWHASCADTEGNVFGMMQEDTAAGM
jgi:hypothetical protein